MPGACIVVVRQGEEDIVTGFGYADLDKKVQVTADTLFELASCSKSFTALAALQMQDQGLISLNDPVSKYLPWFFVKYGDKEYQVTLRQLLLHTSGIPWQTISCIPRGNSRDSLERTVKKIVGIELNHRPGNLFEYATVNYDIIGAVIEKVSGSTFEEYMKEHVFRPLGLNRTSVGVEESRPGMASGYKIGLFLPGRYKAPVFRGNNPAAYVVSNGGDICRWLKIQMGLLENPLSSLVEKSQKSVKISSYSRRIMRFSYALGWIIAEKKREIYHTGLNPNFSSYIGFRPKEKIGVAVLTNANSIYTLILAEYVMAQFSGERSRRVYLSQFSVDKYTPFISLLLGVYLVFILDFIVSISLDILQGFRRFAAPTEERALLLFMVSWVLIWVFVGFYLIPQKFKRLTWRTLILWTSKVFPIAVFLFLASLLLSYSVFLLLLLFPK